MHKFNSTLIRCLLFAFITFGPFIPESAGKGNVYTLAVIPSAPPVSMHKLWTPFSEQLYRETGIVFRLKMYEKMAEFERDIWAGTPDFIFSSPIQLMVAHKSNRYLPLVRGGKKVSVGLFVRKDSPISGISDLTGKTISFVGNKNLCSVFMQHQLGQHKGKLTFTQEYTGSTRNVIINILRGKSDAGAVFIPEIAKESEETRNQLREILATPEIAPHPLSAHPRVPLKVQEAVRKATLAIAATKEGAELLKSIRLGSPVIADYKRDYLDLEEIDVESLTNWGQ